MTDLALRIQTSVAARWPSEIKIGQYRYFLDRRDRQHKLRYFPFSNLASNVKRLAGLVLLVQISGKRRDEV